MKQTKKLRLTTQTVRVLASADLRQAHGGMPPVSWLSMCPTEKCPSQSTCPGTFMDCPPDWPDPPPK